MIKIISQKKNKLKDFWFKENLLINLIRIITSAVFFISAIGKLVTIDNFEIFVFSVGYFSFDVASILSRLLIGLEFFIAITIITRVYNKTINLFAITLLIIFTLFIVFLQLNHTAEHCHCFGDIIQLNNIQTIVKNIILIGLCLLLFRFGKTSQLKKIYIIIASLFSFILPFAVSVPDTFVNIFSTIDREEQYSSKDFYEYYNSTSELQQYKIIGFISSGCEFCQLAMKKIDVIAKKTNKQKDIVVVHWGDDKQINDLYTELGISYYKSIRVQPGILLKITKGSIPRFLLIDNGKVINVFGLRDMNEEILTNHLLKK